MTGEVKQSRDWLQTTLASIRDGAIATDQKGRITFLNGVSQILTGLVAGGGCGQPLEEIFVIRNEETGEEVENPVSKVLRLGCIVGPANHTELSAKDGRRVLIDDSAAPIRDTRGNIDRFVLVFRDISEKRSNLLFHASRNAERCCNRMSWCAAAEPKQ